MRGAALYRFYVTIRSIVFYSNRLCRVPLLRRYHVLSYVTANDLEPFLFRIR